MVVVDGKGIPLGGILESAAPAEVTLAERTLNAIKVPCRGRGRPKSRPKRVIADKGYDGDPLRKRLKTLGITIFSPRKRNRKGKRAQQKRMWKRYRSRFTVERTFAWIGNFRRLTTRFDRYLSVYQGFFYLILALITMRHCEF